MGRGPSYPYVGLEDAIALTRKMYEYAKRAPAPVESIVTEAWKYSTTSSSGQKVLAALKSFGMVEDAPGTNGKALKISPRAIRILLDDEDSQERKEELKRAALSPRWYEFCWRTWGREMPPSMRSNLMIEHGFVESTVDGFLRDYRKSLAFAGLLDETIFGKKDESSQQATKSLGIGDYVQWESQGIYRMPEAKRLTRFTDDAKYAFVEGSSTGIPVEELIAAQEPSVRPDSEAGRGTSGLLQQAALPEDVKLQTDTLSLADGITLRFQWPSTITEEAYQDFLYQLEGFKRRVARSVQKKTEPIS